MVMLLTAALVWFFGWNSSKPDVTAYWHASMNLRQGEPLYGPAPAGVAPKAFLYPPSFAALFAPLTYLPPLSAYATWMALHFAFLGWLVWATARLAQVAGWPAQGKYLALLLLWLPAPTGGDFQEGQVNLLMASLVATGLLLIEERRPWGGGLMLALATHVKLLPVILLVPLLLQGRRRAAAASACAVVALVFLPAFFTVPREGWSHGMWRAVSLHIDFFQAVVAPALSDAKVVGNEQFYVLNNSLVAVFHRLFGAGVTFSPLPEAAAWRGPLLFSLPRPLLRAAALTIGGTLFVGALVLARRTAHDRTGRVVALGLSYVSLQLVTLNCWEHHLVFLALVLAPLAVLDGAHPQLRRGLVALGIAVFGCWTGPYLLDPFARLFGADTPGVWLATSRAWGLPTAAVLLLCGLSFTARRECEGPVRDAG